MGEIDENEAKRIQKHVEELVKAQGKREPNSATAKWRDYIAEHDNGLYDGLLRVWLVPELLRHQQAAAAADATPSTLAAFLDNYIAVRRKAMKKDGTRQFKESTIGVYDHTRRCLVDHFGATRPLNKITAGEADDWRLWLEGELSDNTVRRRCGMAKQFFPRRSGRNTFPRTRLRI